MQPLEEIREKLAPPALDGADLQKYYTNLLKARSDNPLASLKRILLANPQGQKQILFSGYRGCGKSTELNKLISELGDGFVTAKLNLLKELDPININYVEIIILAMEKLFQVVKDNNIKVSKSFLDSIQAWVNSEEIEKVKTFSTELGAETGLEMKADIPWFLNFFARIRAAATVSSSAKKTIREVIEPRLSDLLNQCNDLILNIKAQIGDRGLLLVIEDMDKLSPEKAEELFFNHSNILSGLKANVIFTFPIALRHHPKANVIKTNFPEDFELPMVKVKAKDGSNFESGREGLYELIQKRINPSLFENDELIYSFIELSGGCIRDLFRMIIDASDNALNNEREVITEADFNKSAMRLKRNYRQNIADKSINNEVIISAEEYFQTLVKVAESPNKQAPDTMAMLDLRQNLCVLSYNDEGWCDVHPLVRQILIDDGRIKANK